MRLILHFQGNVVARSSDTNTHYKNGDHKENGLHNSDDVCHF